MQLENVPSFRQHIKMQTHLDRDEAKRLLELYKCWFGAPAIVLHGETIDGRERIAAMGEMQLSRLGSKTPMSRLDTKVPTIEVNSSGEAAKLLCSVGHYDRARRFVPAELTKLKDVAAYCHCEEQVVAPIVTVKKPPNPLIRRAQVANRRSITIERVMQLITQAEQTTGTVTADELRKAVEVWL